MSAGTVRLEAGASAATVALQGAEPLSWIVGGRERLWHGDPAHWGFRAPILFPVVGASQGGVIRLEGRAYPMPQHGFARHARFDLVEAEGGRARLRLSDTDETRAAFPFRFSLDVHLELAEDALSLRFTVANVGEATMPYAIGFHPAFPWPLSGEGRGGHSVVFDEPEAPAVPEIAPGGLIARRTRPVPLQGRVLPLAPELFTEALVFLDARSRGFRFEAPDGSAIRMDVENLQHLAVWTKPDAPFLSLEAWSGHADYADFAGELHERASISRLEPGEAGQHVVRMSWRGPSL